MNYIHVYETAIFFVKYSEYCLHNVYIYNFNICFKKTMYFVLNHNYMINYIYVILHTYHTIELLSKIVPFEANKIFKLHL